MQSIASKGNCEMLHYFFGKTFLEGFRPKLRFLYSFLRSDNRQDVRYEK